MLRISLVRIVAALLCGVTVFAAEQSRLARDQWEKLVACQTPKRLPISLAEQERFLGMPPGEIMPLLNEGMRHSSEDVRSYSYSLMIGLVASNGGTDVGQRASLLLLKALCDEKDEAEVGCDAEILAKLSRDSFSDEGRAAIAELFLSGPDRSELALLAGVVDTPAVREKLQRLVRDGYPEQRWYASLALARLGDPNAIARCLERIRGIENPDRRMVAMEWLAYIRRPETLPMLIDAVNSDQETPTRGDSVGYQVAHQAVGIGKRFIKGFPAPTQDKRRLTKAEIQRCRTWLAENPNLQIIP